MECNGEVEEEMDRLYTVGELVFDNARRTLMCMVEKYSPLQQALQNRTGVTSSCI